MQRIQPLHCKADGFFSERPLRINAKYVQLSIDAEEQKCLKLSVEILNRLIEYFAVE